MREILTSWPATLLGAIALAVVANLLTPLARRVGSVLWVGFRQRRARAIRAERDRYVAALANGAMIYHVLRDLSYATTGIILLGVALVFAAISTRDQDPLLLDLFGLPPAKLVQTIASFLIVAVMTFLWLRLWQMFKRSIAFAIAPKRATEKANQQLARLGEEP